MSGISACIGSARWLELPAAVIGLESLGDAVIATFEHHPPMLIRERDGRMYAVTIFPGRGPE